MEKKTKGLFSLIFLFLVFILINFDFVSADTNVYVDPASSIVSPNSTFEININISTNESVWAVSIVLSFDSSMIEVINVTEGDFLKQGSSTFPIIIIDNTTGKVNYDSTRFGVQSGATGQGNLLTMEFKVIGSGQSNISIDKAQFLRYPDLIEILVTTTNGTIRVNNPPSASNLQLTPVLPKTTDDLIASYNYSDLDGDAESGTEIRWYKSDGATFILQAAYNNNLTVPSSATSKDEQWYFTVRPRDGVMFGDIKISNTVTIQNSAPIINWFSPSNLSLKLRIGLSILFNHTSSDVDNDVLNYSWKLDNITRAITESWNFVSNVSDCGQHKIKLEVSDSQLSDSKEWDVRVLLQGDVDENNKVDIFDLAKIGLCYGQPATGTCTNADLNQDIKIDIFDLATVGLNYGKTC